MATIALNYYCDLNQAVKVQYIDGNVFSGDNAGNTISVFVMDGDQPATIGGSVSADVIRADGSTVAVSGALDGNRAYVILPQACYAVPGPISIVIKNTQNTTITTIAALVGNVYRSSTDEIVDPGTIIPSIQSLISAIETAVASIPADYSSLWTSLAPAFNSSTNYVAGQYVTNNGGLYRFTKAHSGEWSSSDVVATNLGGDISDLKSAFEAEYEQEHYWGNDVTLNPVPSSQTATIRGVKAVGNKFSVWGNTNDNPAYIKLSGGIKRWYTKDTLISEGYQLQLKTGHTYLVRTYDINGTVSDGSANIYIYNSNELMVCAINAAKNSLKVFTADTATATMCLFLSKTTELDGYSFSLSVIDVTDFKKGNELFLYSNENYPDNVIYGDFIGGKRSGGGVHFEKNGNICRVNSTSNTTGTHFLLTGNELKYTTTANGLKTWINESTFELIDGHWYKIVVVPISGTFDTKTNCTINLKQGDNVTFRTLALASGNESEPVKFNSSAGSKVIMTFYGSVSIVATDYVFGVYLLDVTENMEQKEIKSVAYPALEKTGLLNYWGTNRSLAAGDPSTTNGIGVSNNGDEFTLNGSSTSVSRISISGELYRANSAADLKSRSKTIKLIAGHTYKAEVKYVSGSYSRTDTGNYSVAMILRNISDNDVFNIPVGDIAETVEYTFSVSSDGMYGLFLYIDANTTLTNYVIKADITDLSDNEGVYIEAKYRNEMDTTIASVKALMTEPCLIFPKVTDIHYRTSASNIAVRSFDKTIENIRYFMNHLKCDGILCLGDITDGGYQGNFPVSVEVGIPVIEEIMERMQIDKTPVYFAVGNHDDFRYVNPYMTANEIYGYYMRQSDKNVIYDEQSYGTNYYKDFPGMKTRLICFNTNNLPTNSSAGSYGISNRTLEWVTEVLEDMPQDYIGMMITHAPIYYGMTSVDHPYNISNSENLRNAIRESGKLCFVLTGHVHFDVSYQASNDVLNIAGGCTKCEGDITKDVTTVGGIVTGKRYGRSIADETEDLWDVVILRPFSKKLDLIRFGAGIDQHFDLA